MIGQGDVFWIDLGEPFGSEPGFRRPYVVIQNDVFNRSGLQTVVVCGLTTNLQRAGSPGNVLLDQGEGNLRKQSVVNVTQIMTVDKSRLAERVGTLSASRLLQILTGIRIVLWPRELTLNP